MSQIENDRKIINDFKDSVSWGDETITTENYGRAYLPEKLGSVKAPEVEVRSTDYRASDRG